jgi:hypothetical protein
MIPLLLISFTTNLFASELMTNEEFIVKRKIFEKKLEFQKDNLFAKYNIVKNVLENYENLTEKMIKDLIVENSLASKYTIEYIKYIDNKDKLLEILKIEELLKSKKFVILNRNLICIEKSYKNTTLKKCELSYIENTKKYYVLDSYSNNKLLNFVKDKEKQEEMKNNYFLSKVKVNSIYEKAKQNENGFKDYLENKWSGEEKKRLFASPYIKKYININ